jgi:hypothetical protein
MPSQSVRLRQTRKSDEIGIGASHTGEAGNMRKSPFAESRNWKVLTILFDPF